MQLKFNQLDLFTRKSVEILFKIIGQFKLTFKKALSTILQFFTLTCLSEFLAAYRKSDSSSHVLVRLVENCKKELDNKKYVGTMLMDLSKAFDCISHKLLIAKMDAYVFSENTLTVFFFPTLNDENKAFKLTTRV